MRIAEVPGVSHCMAACRDCRGEPTPIYPYRSRLPMYEDFRSGGQRLIRVCGVTRTALREDEDEYMQIRLTAEDVAGELDGTGKPLAPGLYAMSRETFERFHPRVMNRLANTPAINDRGEPILSATGEPIMILTGKPADRFNRQILV